MESDDEVPAPALEFEADPEVAPEAVADVVPEAEEAETLGVAGAAAEVVADAALDVVLACV